MVVVPEEHHEQDGDEEEADGRLESGEHPVPLVLILVIVFLNNRKEQFLYRHVTGNDSCY